MQRMIVGKLILIGAVVLSAGSAFGAPLPPPPTPVGGDLWPYVTTGAVLDLGAWKMWKK
jgi:hypothetical protein